MLAESADGDVAEVIAEMEESKLEAARKLEFEKAAMIRDQIEILQSGKMDAGTGGPISKPKRKKGKSVYTAKGLPRKRKPR